ncbi:hypothetical protein I4I80_02705 [Pseudomonas syringae pv. tomato]|nr:hypothetical protein [Pseudomonas syringae pv. tomato]
MNLLNANDLTWPEKIAFDDFKIFEGRVPCEGVASAERWLEKKTQRVHRPYHARQ